MAYDTPFDRLNVQTVFFLNEPANLDACMPYIDGLAMMHDLLIGYGSEPQNPRFENVDTIFSVVEGSLTDLLDCSRRMHRHEADEAYNNLRLNSATALDLREVFTAPSQIPHPQSRLLVDEFVDQLLEQYDHLRHPKRLKVPPGTIRTRFP